MKIQCNVCEASEANVLCCADEAALCWSCDQKVHSANKLASKHQRVPLSTSSSRMPTCDICQETFGYFFCLEDRALLCRKCDLAVHKANPLVSAHQRFLLTGVKVGLEATDTSGPSSSSGKAQSQDNGKFSEQENHNVPQRVNPISSFDPHNNSNNNDSNNSNHNNSSDNNNSNNNDDLKNNNNNNNYKNNNNYNDNDNNNSDILYVQTSGSKDFSSSKLPVYGGSVSGSGVPQWSQLDDFLGLDDFGTTYNCMDYSSSKADNGKLGDSDSSQNLHASIGELDDEDCTGLIPDTFWAVPELSPSPPTASGLRWPKNHSNLSSDCAVFVPDVSSLPPSAHYYSHRQRSHSNISKRRRQF